MTWVSLVSEPWAGLRCPPSSDRPSPDASAPAGSPTRTTAAVARAYRPEMRARARASLECKRSLPTWLTYSCDTSSPGELRAGTDRAAGRPHEATEGAAASTLARHLRRVHRHRDGEIQRGADDAGLLDRVRGGVALARRGALRAADV